MLNIYIALQRKNMTYLDTSAISLKVYYFGVHKIYVSFLYDEPKAQFP